MAARGRGRSKPAQYRPLRTPTRLWLGRYSHWQRSSANLPYMGMGPGKIEQKR